MVQIREKVLHRCLLVIIKVKGGKDKQKVNSVDVHFSTIILHIPGPPTTTSLVSPGSPISHIPLKGICQLAPCVLEKACSQCVRFFPGHTERCPFSQTEDVMH